MNGAALRGCRPVRRCARCRHQFMGRQPLCPECHANDPRLLTTDVQPTPPRTSAATGMRWLYFEHANVAYSANAYAGG